MCHVAESKSNLAFVELVRMNVLLEVGVEAHAVDRKVVCSIRRMYVGRHPISVLTSGFCATVSMKSSRSYRRFKRVVQIKPGPRAAENVPRGFSPRPDLHARCLHAVVLDSGIWTSDEFI